MLFGNLAPDGCVVKQSAVCDEILQHEGPARVFNSEEDATTAIMNVAVNGDCNHPHPRQLLLEVRISLVVGNG